MGVTLKETGRPIAVLADLQGPKLRIGRMAGGPIELAPGDTLRMDLDPAFGVSRGTNLLRIAQVPLQHPAG